MKYILPFCISLTLLLFLNTDLVAQENAINDLIDNHNYEEAIDVILMSGKIEKLPLVSLENLGLCYVMTRNYNEAEIVYAELLSRPKADIANYVGYAELLLIKGQYQKAKDNFLIYLAENEDDLNVYNRMISCDSLKKWEKIEKEYTVENFSEINSTYNEICANKINQDFIFISNRNDNNKIDVNSNINIPNIFSFDLGESNQIKDYITKTYWCSMSIYNDATKKYAHSLRKVQQEVEGFNLSNSIIMFENLSNSSVDGFEKFEWLDMPEDINVAHPSFNKNGDRLYFASDMSGGFGGMDIYYSDFKNNKWSVPVNLGNLINTPLDEIAPVVDDSVLYFSSMGLPGYGNFDVFVSRFEGNVFSKPENLKAPVNSIGQDLFFYPYEENMSLISSNRSADGKGGFDVFKLTKIQEEPEIVPVDTVVKIIHQLDIANLNLPRVFFGINSSEIYPNYDEIIKNIADSLILYKDVNVRLSGYTDISGNDKINQELSVSRAKAVAQKLIDLGVSESQITAEGLGVGHDNKIDDLKYHVIIGTTNNDEGAQWFSNLLDDKYSVIVLPNANYFSYCVGDFDNLAEANVLRKKLENEYDLTCFSVASYLGRCLPNFNKAINRRVDFVLYREK